MHLRIRLAGANLLHYPLRAGFLFHNSRPWGVWYQGKGLARPGANPDWVTFGQAGRVPKIHISKKVPGSPHEVPGIYHACQARSACPGTAESVFLACCQASLHLSQKPGDAQSRNTDGLCWVLSMSPIG
jgi:hypothetical protein